MMSHIITADFKRHIDQKYHVNHSTEISYLLQTAFSFANEQSILPETIVIQLEDEVLRVAYDVDIEITRTVYATDDAADILAELIRGSMTDGWMVPETIHFRMEEV